MDKASDRAYFWFGCTVLLLSLAGAFVALFLAPAVAWQTLGLSAIGALSGIFVLVSDRAEEISFGRLGRIKTAAKQATQDAAAIGALKEQLERQTAELKANARTTESLKILTKFIRLSTAAFNDDRRAFDSLGNWDEVELQNEAREVHRNIVLKHSRPHYVTDFDFTWVQEEFALPAFADTSPLDAIRRKLDATTAEFRPVLLVYLWKHPSIPTEDKKELLRDVMEFDDSLQTVEYAGWLYAKILGARYKPLMVVNSTDEEILGSWEFHKKHTEENRKHLH